MKIPSIKFLYTASTMLTLLTVSNAPSVLANPCGVNLIDDGDAELFKFDDYGYAIRREHNDQGKTLELHGNKKQLHALAWKEKILKIDGVITKTYVGDNINLREPVLFVANATDEKIESLVILDNHLYDRGSVRIHSPLQDFLVVPKAKGMFPALSEPNIYLLVASKAKFSLLYFDPLVGIGSKGEIGTLERSVGLDGKFDEAEFKKTGRIFFRNSDHSATELKITKTPVWYRFFPLAPKYKLELAQ